MSIHVYDPARHIWVIDYCLCHVIRALKKPYQDFVDVTSLHPTTVDLNRNLLR